MTNGPDVGEVRSGSRVDEGLVGSLAVPGLAADPAGKGGQAARSSLFLVESKVVKLFDS